MLKNIRGDRGKQKLLEGKDGVEGSERNLLQQKTSDFDVLMLKGKQNQPERGDGVGTSEGHSSQTGREISKRREGEKIEDWYYEKAYNEIKQQIENINELLELCHEINSNESYKKHQIEKLKLKKQELQLNARELQLHSKKKELHRKSKEINNMNCDILKEQDFLDGKTDYLVFMMKLRTNMIKGIKNINEYNSRNIKNRYIDTLAEDMKKLNKSMNATVVDWQSYSEQMQCEIHKLYTKMDLLYEKNSPLYTDLHTDVCKMYDERMKVNDKMRHLSQMRQSLCENKEQLEKEMLRLDEDWLYLMQDMYKMGEPIEHLDMGKLLLSNQELEHNKKMMDWENRKKKLDEEIKIMNKEKEYLDRQKRQIKAHRMVL